jgi:hypothetical protein
VPDESRDQAASSLSLSSQARDCLRLRMITRVSSLHMEVKRDEYLQYELS